MLWFFVEALAGGFLLWHGRRWLVARLDETFGNSPENFDTDEDRRGWPGFVAFLTFFGVIVLAASWKLAPLAGMIPLIGVPILVWSIGNVSNWRRLESGNPLRAPLDSVLASEGIRPSIVRFWRNPALLPTFTFDGRIEIPSAFVRHFSPEEQRFIYLALSEETTARFRRKVICEWILTLGGMGCLIFVGRYFFHSYRFLIGAIGPMFCTLFRGTSAERRLTLDRLKRALETTKDFAAAERAIYRTLPEKTADKLVSELREWWAVQNPANPTVVSMRNNSVSPTQRVGMGP